MNQPALCTETKKQILRILFLKAYNFLATNELRPDKCLKMEVTQRDLCLKEHFLIDTET